MTKRYEIDTAENGFAIRIFNGDDNVPYQFQPDYPNGDPFDSEAEAAAWAEASIAAHDPAVLFNAPSGKGLPGESKTTPLMALKASAKAKLIAGTPLTAEEVDALIS
jgi:hypothetical protein